MPARSLITLQIFGRYIVLRYLFRVDFSYVCVGRILHSFDRPGLERLTLLHQFLDALRPRFCSIRQTLGISGLACRPRTPTRFFIVNRSVRPPSLIV